MIRLPLFRWIGFVVKRIIQTTVIASLVAVMVAFAVFIWYHNRPRPDDTQRMLFQGIEYIRDVRDDPRPMVIHIVKIDLDAPGIRFFVTPAETEFDGEHMLAGRTTSDFLEEFDLQLAINGDFFDPWYSITPFYYYPQEGDPVGVRGLSASNGDLYTAGYMRPNSYNTLFLSAQNEVSFTWPPAVYNAISGWLMFVQYGQENIARWADRDFVNDPHPRTAVALDITSETLILAVVDGRQPNYSEGITLPELAEIMIEYGAYHALNLDGGGSSTLVRENGDGDADVLNSPIDSRIPGRERVIANHLGVYALPLEP